LILWDGSLPGLGSGTGKKIGANRKGGKNEGERSSTTKDYYKREDQKKKGERKGNIKGGGGFVRRKKHCRQTLPQLKTEDWGLLGKTWKK